MAERRFTFQVLPGGEVSPPLTQHESITSVMEITGQGERTIESALDQLSRFVPRVTIPGETLDRPDVRIAIA